MYDYGFTWDDLEKAISDENYLHAGVVISFIMGDNPSMSQLDEVEGHFRALMDRLWSNDMTEEQFYEWYDFEDSTLDKVNEKREEIAQKILGCERCEDSLVFPTEFTERYNV